MGTLVGRLAKAGERIARLTTGRLSLSVGELAKLPEDMVDAFLQALVSTSSEELLAMSWLLIWGAQVSDLQVRYYEQKEFSLRVTIASEYLPQPATFCSADVDDLALLRHLGILRVDGRPVLDGFFPLHMAQ